MPASQVYHGSRYGLSIPSERHRLHTILHYQFEFQRQSILIDEEVTISSAFSPEPQLKVPPTARKLSASSTGHLAVASFDPALRLFRQTVDWRHPAPRVPA
jgi:hypothetical protein